MPQENAPKSIFKQEPHMNRKAGRDEKLAKLKTDMAGEGQYVFENNTKGDLHLPRPTKSGRKIVGKGQQFIGDSYYMQMVKSHDLKFIREVLEPMNNKLITEQPPVVTKEGQVEFVGEPKLEQEKNPGDVLLNEAPVDGIKILS